MMSRGKYLVQLVLKKKLESKNGTALNNTAVETLDKQLHSQQGTERTARPHPPDEIER